MKNLKIFLKTLPVILLLAFASCKKDKSNDPQNDLDVKQYYIAGRYVANAATGLKLPFIIKFDVNAQAFISNGLGTSDNGNYTFKDGVLTIVYNSTSKDTFHIENGQITSYDGVSKLDTYVLQKTPDQNQFNGKTFNGSLSTVGSNIFLITKMKFSDTKYGETSLGDPVLNKDYSLTNNACGGSNTGNNGTLTFFVLVNGKLEVSRSTPTNVNGSTTISTGTLQPTN